MILEFLYHIQKEVLPVTDHAAWENHVIVWDGTRLVVTENQDRASRIQEAIWIKHSTENMNHDWRGAYQLSDIMPIAPFSLISQRPLSSESAA